jgi:hypothetical protein
MDHYPRLIIGKRYAVETRNKNICIGTYIEYVRQYGYIIYYVLDDVTKYHSFLSKNTEKLKTTAFFSPTDTFYDLEEIRLKSKMAQQIMEKRALDMILKRLVNEIFEWL